VEVRLLLLPGMDGTGLLFAPLVRALPAALAPRVVSYPPCEPLGYAALVPLVEAAAAGGGQFVVVGESFSGPLALLLAARRPPGLRGVVLCASFVRSPLPVPALWRWVAQPWLFRFRPLGLISWALLGRHRRGLLGRLLGEAVLSVSGAAMAARVQAVAGVDVTAELRACPVPVLYLRASEDWVVRPRCWRLVKAERPDAEVAVLSGPHLVLQAAPSEAATVLVSFCNRVATSNQTLQQTGHATDGSACFNAAPA
jgi:pimeloyl-ACP methyl ester carboxylesterase